MQAGRKGYIAAILVKVGCSIIEEKVIGVEYDRFRGSAGGRCRQTCSPQTVGASKVLVGCYFYFYQLAVAVPQSPDVPRCSVLLGALCVCVAAMVTASPWVLPLPV